MAAPASSVGGKHTVTALFDDRESAEAAYRGTCQLGYEKSDVTLVMSDATRERCFPDEPRRDTELGDRAHETTGAAGQGSELGGPLGGTLGTLAPAAVGLGSLLLIPGIIFASPVVVALAAAGVVALVGGLAGALATWGLPPSRIEEYEMEIRKGGVLMGVTARNADDAKNLGNLWSSSGGRLVHA